MMFHPETPVFAGDPQSPQFGHTAFNHNQEYRLTQEDKVRIIAKVLAETGFTENEAGEVVERQVEIDRTITATRQNLGIE